jgi:N-acetylglutamate synthase-like GNAT family acetyltransferase
VYFAPNERAEYDAFLQHAPEGYEVCEAEGRILGAFGLFDSNENERRLNWILVDPDSKGIGVGRNIMERVIKLTHTSKARLVNIAASQKSAAFFAHFGATVTLSTEDRWGPGLDRVDMVLPLEPLLESEI